MTAIDNLVKLGFIISGVIAILIVMSVILIGVLSVYAGPEVKIPSVLENWGGVVVGFYFGTFISLIKDYMKMNDDATRQTPPAPNVQNNQN